MNQIITVGSDANATDIPISFSDAEGSVEYVSGSGLVFAIGGSGAGANPFAQISGNFSFQKLDTVDGSTQVVTATTLLIGATDVSAFVGTEMDQSDETGIKLTNAKLGLEVFKQLSSVVGATTYALQTNGGSVVVEGIPGLTLSAGDLSLSVNNTGNAIKDSIQVGTEVFSAPMFNNFILSESLVSGSSLSVTLNGTVIATGYHSAISPVTQQNSVLFDSSLAPGSILSITYQGLQPDPVSETFTGGLNSSVTLAKTPITGQAVSVTLNGIPLPSNSYSISGATITLGATLSASDVLTTTYNTAKQYIDTFTVPSASSFTLAVPVQSRLM